MKAEELANYIEVARKYPDGSGAGEAIVALADQLADAQRNAAHAVARVRELEAEAVELSLRAIPRDELMAMIKEAAESNPNGKCVHCGNLIPKTVLNHWEACEKHPAGARVRELEGEREEAVLLLRRWRQGYHPLPTDDTDALLARLTTSAREPG